MRFKSGLFPPFLSFLFLLFSAHTSLVIADSSIQHSNQNSLEDPFLWVEKLGSSDWIEREESAEKLLEAGEASVEALRTALTHPDLEVQPWIEDELVVFCAPDHPLAGKPRLDDHDLKAATWIVRESGSGTRQTFERGMHGILPDLNLLLELEHTEAIKRLAALAADATGATAAADGGCGCFACCGPLRPMS